MSKLFFPKSKIDGENLAEDNSKVSLYTVLGTSLSAVVSYIMFTTLINFIFNAITIIKYSNLKIHDQILEISKYLSQYNHFFIPESFKHLIVILLFTTLLTLIMYKRLSNRFDKLAYGQKGDNRLSTFKEIKQQYRSIPDSKESFEGVGGIPVSHKNKNYFIDTDTVNTILIGTSRSGKGEMIIFPLTDILSRAKNQSSMIFNDPKGELFSSSKDTLEKRGYEVQVLNVLDPMQSMSYNPLDLIVDAWRNKDYQRAQTLTNSFSHQMLDNPDAGANKWVYDGAKHMLNGLILGLVDYCDKNNQLEKVTLYNVTQMLVELYIPISEGSEKTFLDTFFDNMPAGHMAKSQYASASNASDKAKGSIIQTVIDSLQVFTIEDIAKMTSSNSFKLKSVGFPKFISLKLDKKFYDKPIKISFYDSTKQLIYSEVSKPNAQGLLELNFNCNLESNCIMHVVCDEVDFNLRLRYEIQVLKNSKYLKLISHRRNKQIHLDYIDWINVHYSNKPIAIFMITPDYDQSKNMITTTFVDQLYTVLMENASKTRGKKCFRRVHFILDEFGNMPALTDLDTKLSVCLSRNVLFDLAVQSYSQLFSKYNKEVGQIAKENCQNHIIIKTLDVSTLEEVSKRIGKKTVVSNNRTEKVMDISSSSSMSAQEEYLMTTERLEAMLEHEMIVLKPLHRKDLKGNRVRPYPIFNTKDTAMPYRYQFLSQEFNTDIDINDININSMHKNLSLIDNSVNYESIKKSILTSMILEDFGEDNNNSLNYEDNHDVQDKSKQIHELLQRYIKDSDLITEYVEEINKGNFNSISYKLKSTLKNIDYNYLLDLIRKE